MKTDPQHSEEYNFKENGPWSKLSIDFVVPFYNEQDNIVHSHNINSRIERLFNIKNYIYINNGSKDATAANLKLLAESDPKIKIIDVAVNQGYGYGMQQGIKASSADYILTNHADIQFDSYTFFLTHLSLLQSLESPKPIFPRRANRPAIDSFVSTVLRTIISILMRRKVGDFNGQPKLMPRLRVQPGADTYPNDFALDLALYLQFQSSEIIQLPVLQAARLFGESSWNKHPFARVGQMKRWIIAAWKLSIAHKH